MLQGHTIYPKNLHRFCLESAIAYVSLLLMVSHITLCISQYAISPGQCKKRQATSVLSPEIQEYDNLGLQQENHFLKANHNNARELGKLFFLCAQKDTRIGDFGTTAK
jgi:hypothetical protein